MIDRARIVTYKQFRYRQGESPLKEAAEFASTLGKRLINISGNGDFTYSNLYAGDERGRVIVWYYADEP